MGFFLQIYTAAKSFDIDSLHKLILKEGACIDERSGIFTPASKLVVDGHIKAAEFLIYFGADVREILFAAAGYGQLFFARYLLSEYNLSHERMTEGTAFHGLPYPGDLLEKKDEEAESYLRGAAMGGHSDLVTAFLVKYHNNLHVEYHENLMKLYMNLLKGAALGGQFVYRDVLINELQNKYKITLMDKMSLVHFYSAVSDAKQYLTTFNQFDLSNKKAIALGAVVGGYFNYAEQLMADSKESCQEWQDEVVTTAIEYGHFEYALKKYPVPTDAMLTKAIEAGHFYFATRFVSEMKKPIIIDEVMQYALRRRFSAPILLSYTLWFIHDDLRNKVIAELNLKEIFPEPVEYVDHEQQRISLQKKYQANLRQINAWCKPEINTFVIQKNLSTTVKKLNSTLMSYIIMFVTDLSYNEAGYLVGQMTLIIKKSLLMKDLAANRQLISHSFLQKCDQAKSHRELENCLGEQKEMAKLPAEVVTKQVKRFV